MPRPPAFAAFCRPLPWMQWKLLAYGDEGVPWEVVQQYGHKAMDEARQAGIYLDRASMVVLPIDEFPEVLKLRKKKRRSAGD